MSSPDSRLSAQLMAVDIISQLLVSAAPQTLGKQLTGQLRELTGARTAMLVVHNEGRHEHEILCVSPERRSSLFTTDELSNFCIASLQEFRPLVEDFPNGHPVKAVLMQAGIASMARYPLLVSREPVGMLLLFDLPGIDRLEETDEIMHLLAPPIALALKNSLAYRQIERQANELENQVAERTAELLTKNLELQKAEDLHRTVLQTAMEGFWLLDSYLKIIDVNNAYCAMSGYDRQELIGTHIVHIDARDSEEVMAARVNKLIEFGSDRFESEHRRKDGTTFFVEVSVNHIPVEEGLFSVFINDISERRNAAQNLAQSEEKFRRAVIDAPFPIMIHSDDGQVVQINSAWMEITGYALGEIPTIADWTSKAYGMEGPAVRESIDHLYSLDSRLDEGEHQIRTRSGESRVWAFSSAPLGRLSDGRRLVIRMAMDVTERRRAEEALRRSEEQLLQSQKMEAIGKLAGGVAHDFNNILQVIQGYCVLLQMDGSLNDEQQSRLSEIIASAEKATHLTRGLLAFSRKQPLLMTHEDLNDIIRHVHKFLARIIGEDITLNISSTGSELPIVADRGQLEQVLINLATNARDAMQNGGIFSVKTERLILDSTFTDLHHYKVSPGSYALLTVSDTGSGIGKEHLDHIFEPFFTTKEIGKGTGLGMAIVYGIIKQHNGFINVYSEPGQGTTFRLYLPTEEAKDQQPVEKIETERPTAGIETILVAEDDQALQKLVSKILSNNGYEVIVAEDGEDAIEKFKANQDRISLILMDVVMPKKGGKEAFEAIQRIRQGIKVLFTSGYTADFIERRGVSGEEIELIMKPVNPTELLRKIREMLDV